ncbi:MAG: FG-GAP-like repeat-containing protein, partial [Pyrinomonadaceae bacterium]
PLQRPLILSGNDGDETFDVNAFSPNGTLQRPFDLGTSFPGGRRVATGDVTGDGIPDVIVGAGPGGGSQIKVFSGADGSVRFDFFAFSGFTGGVNVATGDVNNDGFDDIIVGADAGGGPHVKVFSGQTGGLLRDFLAFDPGFLGGVSVAGGDVSGEGVDDIIVGAGPGGGFQVKVFDGTAGFEIHGFIASDNAIDGGIQVSSADINGDGKDDILTGTGPGGGPHIKVFDGANLNRELFSFFAFDPEFRGGTRVGGGDMNADGVADIIVAAGPGSPGPEVKIFSGTDGVLLDSFFAFDPTFQGGIFIASSGTAKVVTPPTPTPTPVRLIAPFIGVGPGPGTALDVRVFDPAGGLHASYMPFGAGFTGGVRVATGDINGDGTPDLITGAGGGTSRVRVFDGLTGATLREFFAFPSFAGGVFVGAGDVSGDGFADIIVGAGASAQAGPGGGPHVKVFDGATNTLHFDLMAYPGFSGGVRVAAGDVNGDGFADIITGPAAGVQGGHVKVFDGTTGSEIRSFFAFDPSFTGGIFVGGGDVNNDAIDDIVVGGDEGAAQHVKVFNGSNPGSVLHSFFAYGAGFQGGVRVAAGDVNADGSADIITGAGPGAGPHVKVFSGLNGAEIGSFITYTGLESTSGSTFQGGIFVSAGIAPGGGTGLESDVTPRPNGDGLIISGDVIQMRRFATALDVPATSPNEFQRADSAPRATFGDGVVNSGDVVQARRYATALDPATPAAGPTGPPMRPNKIASIFEDVLGYFFGREISVTPQKPAEDGRVTVAVEITPYGDEIAVGFTLEYDATKLSNPQLALGEGAPSGTALTVNTKQAGKIAILVDSTEAFVASATPKRFVVITFDVSKGATGELPFVLTGSLADKATADVHGNTLNVRYRDGSLQLGMPK